MDTPELSTPLSHSLHTAAAGEPDIVCLSHLRWDCAGARPRHQLARFARRRVFFVEPPTLTAGPVGLDVSPRADNLWVAVPRVARGLGADELEALQRRLVERMLGQWTICDYTLWYQSPAALRFTAGLRPRATVYDCTDERPGDDAHERELLRRADLVFTGDAEMYRAHDARHTGVHLLGADDPSRAWARMQHLLDAAERVASASTWRLDPAARASA